MLWLALLGCVLNLALIGLNRYFTKLPFWIYIGLLFAGLVMIITGLLTYIL